MIDKNRPPKSGPNKKSGAKLSDAPDEVSLPNDIKSSELHRPSVFSRVKNFIASVDDRYSRFNQNQKIAFVSTIGFLIVGSGCLIYAFMMTPEPPPPPQNIVQPEPEPEPEPPKPTTEPSKLTGLPVKLAVNKQPVIGVMIENSPDARPQSGLRQAGVIHEAIAEGGITRFLALYLDETPKKIGPLRSARPYYLRWNLPYQAPYAHVGGSAKALAEIPRLGIRDLDQFHNPSIYERVSYRYAPHNMYSGVDKMLKLAKEKGWKNSTFTPLLRLAEEKPLEKPLVTTVTLNVSYGQYNLVYNYDKKSNSYDRVMGGTKHTDEVSGKQLSPKVVVAMVTDYGIDPNGVNSVYRTTGKGTAYIFQNGTAIKGTWHKKNDKAMLEFRDKKGKTIALNPGQLWITAMGAESQVSYE